MTGMGWVADIHRSLHSPHMLVLAVSRFDADPDRVSNILDLAPTFVARRGEISQQSGRAYSTNLWNLDAHAERLSSGTEHATGLAALLELLSGREDRFARLREEVQPESVTIYGGLYVDQEEQCGVWLDPAEMRVLVNCKVGWGLDIFANE